MTHVSPIKMDKGSPDITPSLRITNTIFAIEDVHHHGQATSPQRRGTRPSWSRVTFSRNLSDTPLPKDYPVPGAGWTILQGAAARTNWKSARSNWIDHHQSGTPPPPEPTPNGPVAFAAAEPDSDSPQSIGWPRMLLREPVCFGITASAADPDAGLQG